MDQPVKSVEGEVTPLGQILANHDQVSKLLTQNLEIIRVVAEEEKELQRKVEFTICRNQEENFLFYNDNLLRVIRSALGE